MVCGGGAELGGKVAGDIADPCEKVVLENGGWVPWPTDCKAALLEVQRMCWWSPKIWAVRRGSEPWSMSVEIGKHEVES